jgi:hypothetical protein
VRVYKHLGGAPDDKRAKLAFYDKVDREIANKVSLNELSVWGKLFKRPIGPISIETWRRGEFSHRQKHLAVHGDAVHPLLYTDLHFNKRQVDDIWPKRS